MMHEFASTVAGGKEKTCQVLALVSAVANVPRRVVIALILRARQETSNQPKGREL